MIAHIFDAEGRRIKETEGTLEIVEANVPEGGRYEIVQEYVRPVRDSVPVSPAPRAAAGTP